MDRRLALLAFGLLCLTACVRSQQYRKYKDVPGLIKTEEGYHLDVDGVIWHAAKHQDGGIYFFNAESQEAQWHDPRGPAPSGENIEIKVPEGKPAAKSGSMTVAVVAVIPIVLFALGMAGRIAYLQIYYPELLWPTKERKERKRTQGGKFKPQKQRGKLNQDGKGGRSANS